MCLPADAPRIAFSLDNTLLGRIGITDATYQRVMTAAGGRLIKMRPDAAGDPEVVPEAVKVSIALTRDTGIAFSSYPALPVADFDRLASAVLHGEG